MIDQSDILYLHQKILDAKEMKAYTIPLSVEFIERLLNSHPKCYACEAPLDKPHFFDEFGPICSKCSNVIETLRRTITSELEKEVRTQIGINDAVMVKMLIIENLKNNKAAKISIETAFRIFLRLQNLYLMEAALRNTVVELKRRIFEAINVTKDLNNARGLQVAFNVIERYFSCWLSQSMSDRTSSSTSKD